MSDEEQQTQDAQAQTADGHGDSAAPREQDAPKLEDLSYPEYLKLTNPGKSDEEIAKMVRKENRYVWLGRFQILALILIVIVVLVFIFTN